MDTEIRGEGVEAGEFDLLTAGEFFLVVLLPQEPLWPMQITRRTLIKTPGPIVLVSVMAA